ncbi:MAG: type II secretion system protein, partial [Parvularculaceae bacterium]
MSARKKQRGVTLLELLVVMAILALVASIAVLSAPPARGAARDEAERFAARFIAACEESIV